MEWCCEKSGLWDVYHHHVGSLSDDCKRENEGIYGGWMFHNDEQLGEALCGSSSLCICRSVEDVLLGREVWDRSQMMLNSVSKMSHTPLIYQSWNCVRWFDFVLPTLEEEDARW